MSSLEDILVDRDSYERQALAKALEEFVEIRKSDNSINLTYHGKRLKCDKMTRVILLAQHAKQRLGISESYKMNIDKMKELHKHDMDNIRRGAIRYDFCEIDEKKDEAYIPQDKFLETVHSI